MLIAPAQAIGFPPKVEPWSPAFKVNSVLSKNSVAPRGSPPASPFAVDTISGVKP